jgi:hypothetical protein
MLARLERELPAGSYLYEPKWNAFRHPARFRRWRLDRVPHSCTLDQLDAPALRLDELLSLP